MDGRDGLTTASHNGAKTSTTSVWLSLPDKQMRRTKADKCMTCFTTRWVTGKATVGPGPQTLGKHSWPRPRPPRCPLPYPTSDPTLRVICRSAPCRRPHDLIKCNYHQPLVLRGRRGVSGGETSCFRETNRSIIAHFSSTIFSFFLLAKNETRPHIIPSINHCSKKKGKNLISWQFDILKFHNFLKLKIGWLFEVKGLEKFCLYSLKISQRNRKITCCSGEKLQTYQVVKVKVNVQVTCLSFIHKGFLL